MTTNDEPTFTQSRVNSLLASERRKHEESLAELDAKNKALNNKEGSLKDALEVERKRVAALTETAIDAEIRHAAQHFHSPEDVAVLLRKNAKYDFATRTVQMSDGIGQQISVSQAVDNFAAKHPYLVKSADNQQAESPKLEDVFGPKSDSRLASQLHKDDPAKYQAMKKQAKAKGLVG